MSPIRSSAHDPMQPNATAARPRRPSRRAGDRSGSALATETSPLALRFRAKNMVHREPEHRRKEMACRVLNVGVASVGILITAPLMLVIAALVKLTSPGPVIFRQQRVGLDRRRSSDSPSRGHRRSADRGGRIFTMYKFRTMRPSASAKQQWATQDDPRITGIGKFLRATRLDELPQFFNVLRGDMNIVGPRPEQPEIFEELHDELGGRYRYRQKVLPGITGLAQVSLGYDTDLAGVKQKVDLDIEYIGGRSAARDLHIMAKTVPVMVFRKVWM